MTRSKTLDQIRCYIYCINLATNFKQRKAVQTEYYFQSEPTQASLRCGVCDVLVADVDGFLHPVLAVGPPQNGSSGWVSREVREIAPLLYGIQ